jgi:hypothetical protein
MKVFGLSIISSSFFVVAVSFQIGSLGNSRLFSFFSVCILDASTRESSLLSRSSLLVSVVVLFSIGVSVVSSSGFGASIFRGCSSIFTSSIGVAVISC